MEKRLSLQDAYKIYNELKELIQDGDLHAHMPQVMKICDKSLRALKLEEYKAILIKAVIDCFGRSNYSDYLLAMFGLLQGYDDVTMKLTERRRKYLLDKSCAYGDGKYDSENPPSRDDATNYKRTIKEEDIIERLATFLADIEDWSKYISGLKYMAVERQGKSERKIADLPAPYYTIRQKFVPGEIVPSEQMLAALAASVLKTLFTNGESTEFEMQVFNTTSFEMALKNLYDRGTMSYREYHECCNFLEIVKEAAQNLHEDDEPIKMDKPYDIDWFLRFFDAVANISNEDMRKLWGTVLAREVKHQGSFSLRTVETLRNMAAREALIFQDLLGVTAFPVIFSDDGTLLDVGNMVTLDYFAPTIILQESEKGKTYIHHDNPINNSKILDSNDIKAQEYAQAPSIVMQDCGLISYAEKEYTHLFGVFNLGFIVCGDTIVAIKCIKPMDNMVCIFRYKSLRYLEAARQLYPIVDAKANLNSVIKIAKDWQNGLEHIKDCKFEISVHKLKKKIKNWSRKPSTIGIESKNLLDTEYKPNYFR